MVFVNHVYAACTMCIVLNRMRQPAIYETSSHLVHKSQAFLESSDFGKTKKLLCVPSVFKDFPCRLQCLNALHCAILTRAGYIISTHHLGFQLRKNATKWQLPRCWIYMLFKDKVQVNNISVIHTFAWKQVKTLVPFNQMQLYFWQNLAAMQAYATNNLSEV